MSGNLLINSVEFREKFNKKLEDGNNNLKDVSKKLEDGFKIKNVNPSDFTISYVVGTKYPNKMKFPLFSKIILVKAYEELRRKDYNVTLDYCKMTF